ncbi:MAG: hypothetical protein ACI8QS_001116 [Planctomycetota bacterium]|jgi:hypothetical protein
MNHETSSSTARQSPLSHMVFFKLHDRTWPAIESLLASCKRYLKDHPGVTLFQVGTLVSDLDREVNDLAWDVSLQVTFASRADHDRYQTAPDHLTFIEENKATWASVRVFDATLESD